MPNISYVSAEHIASAAGKYEPQRKNNFTVLLDAKGVGGARTVIQLCLFSASFPVEENEVIKVQFGNEERKVAGRVTYTDEEMVLNDYVDAGVATVLNEWRKKVYNPETGVIGKASDYKCEGSLILTGPDGTTNRIWTLKGAWPKSIKWGDMNMSAAEQNRVTINLCIDRVVLTDAGQAVGV